MFIFDNCNIMQEMWVLIFDCQLSLYSTAQVEYFLWKACHNYYYDKKSIMESKLAVTLEFTDTTARKTLHNYLPRLLSHCIRSWSSVQLLSQFGMGIGSCFESLSLSSAAFFIFKLAFA